MFDYKKVTTTIFDGVVITGYIVDESKRLTMQEALNRPMQEVIDAYFAEVESACSVEITEYHRKAVSMMYFYLNKENNLPHIRMSLSKPLQNDVDTLLTDLAVVLELEFDEEDGLSAEQELMARMFWIECLKAHEILVETLQLAAGRYVRERQSWFVWHKASKPIKRK